jgi:hypothetical protein
MGINTAKRARFVICGVITASIVAGSGPAWGEIILNREALNKNTTTSSATTVSYTQAIRLLPTAARELATSEETFNKAATQNGIAVVALNNSVTTHTELLNILQIAEVDANNAQNNVDDLARGMYMNGAVAPGIVEVILTTNPEGSMSRALETQVFVDAAASNTVTVSEVFKNEVTQFSAETESALREVKANETLVKVAGEAVSQTKAQLSIAQTRYDSLMSTVSTPPKGNYDFKGCKNWLVPRLANAGWKGENLREAWAIVMRESGGRDDGISSSNDWGAMQFNKPTWGDAPWWDDKLILTLDYNLAIGYQMSDGGRTWYPWGLDGRGRPNAAVYYNSGFSDETVQRTIIEPYLRWYEAFPCTEKSAS